MPDESCPLCGQPVTKAALDRHARLTLLGYGLIVVGACVLAMLGALIWLRLIT